MRGTNPLSYILTVILFILLIISPIFISEKANDYMESYRFRKMADAYFEHVMEDRAITKDNYTAFLNLCSEFGISMSLSLTRKDEEYYSNSEIIVKLTTQNQISVLNGDFLEVMLEGKNYIIYRSKTVAIN